MYSNTKRCMKNISSAKSQQFSGKNFESKQNINEKISQKNIYCYLKLT